MKTGSSVETSPTSSASTVALGTTRRGGASANPLHILQMAVTTILLLASSVLLIQHVWTPGFILLALGTVLAMINPYRS